MNSEGFSSDSLNHSVCEEFNNIISYEQIADEYEEECPEQQYWQYAQTNMLPSEPVAIVDSSLSQG